MPLQVVVPSDVPRPATVFLGGSTTPPPELRDPMPIWSPSWKPQKHDPLSTLSQHPVMGVVTILSLSHAVFRPCSRKQRRRVQRRASVLEASPLACQPRATGNLKGRGGLRRLLARLPAPPPKEEMGKLGVGFAFSYALLAGLNVCAMAGVSDGLFIARTGVSPVGFAPFALNSKFVVLLTGVYFGCGTLATPAVALGAAALAPKMNTFLTRFQKRMRCRRWVAILSASGLCLAGFLFILSSVAVLSYVFYGTLESF
mmetsp:Transcript_11274/g.31317  ORF Transcript_11274/g.31317 Transcript_11274/m.31317 type:complete len:257 (-) Transcript_11274:458-1228(-)